MNFYSLILFFFISLFGFQDKQFVEFKSDEVNISINKEYITVTLPFEILESYHIQTEKIENNNFIPTEIHFENPEGFKILNYQFSKVNRENLVLDELKCEVLGGILEVTVELEKKSSSSKALDLKGYLYYQACDDMRCFYPRSLNFSVKKSI
jgi:hypothetical protein